MLEDFGIVGISWRQQGSEALAGYALDGDAPQRLQRFAERTGLAELAYLETCNRVELIFRRAAGGRGEDVRPAALQLLTGHAPRPGAALRTLKAWRGEGACEHLFMVAAGLDSAALGEADVAGQVRACQEQAARWGLSGPGLALLFDEALRIAASVRTDTRLGAGSVSLAELAIAHVRSRLRRTPGPVAIIGVAAMSERAAHALADDGTPLLIVNRSVARARSLADRIGAGALSLERFRRGPPPVEAVFASTGAKGHLLAEGELHALAASAPSGQAPLCLDMAVPANIDATACAKLGIPRIGMDAIVREAERNRSARLAEAAEARALVDAALPRLRRRFSERRHGALFAAVQEHYQHIAGASAARLEKRLPRGLSDEEREVTLNWAGALARQLAHLPIAGLKGLVGHAPEGSLEAFLGGLDAKLAARLRGALTEAAGDGQTARGAGPGESAPSCEDGGRMDAGRKEDDA